MRVHNRDYRACMYLRLRLRHEYEKSTPAAPADPPCCAAIVLLRLSKIAGEPGYFANGAGGWDPIQAAQGALKARRELVS